MSTKVFTNAKVFTSAGDGTLQEALVIQDDKVLFVGSAEEAKALGDKHSATTTDLNGRVLLPGLIDAHTHIGLLGGALTKIHCLGKSIPQIQAELKAFRESKPEAQLVLGCQFQYDAIGVAPHKKYLDEAVPDRPVFIDDSSLHSVWVNSAAIAALGITKDTPNPKGGEFVRDADGEFTGLIKETAVIDIVWPFIVKHTSVDERVKMLEAVFDAYLRTGVTGAVDMATVDEDLEGLEAYIAKNGRLPMRVACHWLMRPGGTDESRAEQVRTAAAHRARLAHHAPWLSIAGIKIISDGVVDSCSAYLSEPYPNGETPGPIWPGDELTKVVTLADELDLQIAVHAIGDAAAAQALDAFESAMNTNGSKPRRHRIEHLEVVSKESIIKLAKLGVVASMQPVHADPVKVVNWTAQLANDHRCDRGFPWKEFEDAQAHLAFGSDAPTAPYHPFPNLYTATTRLSALNTDLKEPEDERTRALSRLCVSSAIRYYSAGSAYSTRSEGSVGSLEVGKSADFCVLSINPWEGLDSLRKAQEAVEETWVAGERVWCRS